MFERIVLAAIITFCAYVFLNLGGKSSNTPRIDANMQVAPGFVHRVASFSF